MDTTELYVLAQFDDETQTILSGYDRILRRHGFTGTQTKNIPYHFTLGSQAAGRETDLLREIDTICAETKAIDIRLDHIGLFGLNVLFIEPNMNFELQRLQQRFFADCGNGYHLWTPHATILIDESETIQEALPILAENFKPLHAKIQSIGLYTFSPTRLIKACGLMP